MKRQSDAEFAAVIGIDWADAKHDICLQPADGGHREFGVLPNRPEAIEEWARLLERRFAGLPIAVCLEIRTGPLVYALQKYNFLILFPVNPATLAKYRQAFTPSRAKDDPTDAELALELLRCHRDKLRCLKPESAAMRTLQQLVEQRRGLVGEQNRISNRLTDALKQYFPQALDWFQDTDTIVFCDFLRRWPTLKHAQRARKATLTSFFVEHNVRYPKLIEQRLTAIRGATPLTQDSAVITPHQLLVEALVEQLRMTLQAIARFDVEIEAFTQKLPDYPLFRALPGAGPAFEPRLTPPSASSGSATRLPQNCRSTQALPRSLNAAARRAGCTGAYNVPSSCDRPLLNGPPHRSRAPSGPVPTVSVGAIRDAHTRPPSLSNGFAFSIVAGRPVHRTTNRLTSLRSGVTVRRYSLRRCRS